MSQPNDVEREKGLEKRPNRTPNMFRGSFRLAYAVFAGLTALACAQSEAPVIGIIPDLIVTLRDPSNIQEVQTTCPKGTASFRMRNLAYSGSDIDQGARDSFGPNGKLGPAVVIGLLMPDNGKQQVLSISQLTIDEGVYEGPQILYCSGDDGVLLKTIKGRYRIIVKK